MAYLAVDRLGEAIFENCPKRDRYKTWADIQKYMQTDCNLMTNIDTRIELPDGTIKKIIGYNLTWKNEPVEI